jgi:4-amino-4-deoxy-L-arabinose transferase-like glycosyltransferase
LWTTLAVLFAIRIAQNGCTSSYLSSGVFIGLAAATKYPAALVAVPVLVASLIDRPTLKNVRLWLTAGTALAIFALVTPFVWLDFGKFWADFSSMAQVHLLGPPHPKSMSSWSEILLINLRFGLGIMGLASKRNGGARRSADTDHVQ